MFVELIFGSLFTFVVIDKYIQYHKNKQWQKIKNITYKNLYFILSNILLKLNWALPKEMRIESYILTEDIETLNDYLPKEDFDVFEKALESIIDKLIQERQAKSSEITSNVEVFNAEEIHSSLLKFKQQSKSDAATLSSSLIPKMLNFSDNIELLDNVIELEELFISLMSKIVNVHKKNVVEDHDVKYIWLLKIKEILVRTRAISEIIQDEAEIN